MMGLAKRVKWNRLYLDESSEVCPPLLVGDLAARDNPCGVVETARLADAFTSIDPDLTPALPDDL